MSIWQWRGSIELGPANGSGNTPLLFTGTGAPSGAVSAVAGSIYLRNNGGAGTTLYVKETDSAGAPSTSGWVAYAASSGASGNATVGSVPYLSAPATFSDSPLFRDDANTLSQRNGATPQTKIIYATYTDAANNSGIRILPFNGGVSTIETFKNGTGTASNLVINAGAGSTLDLQLAGVPQIRITSTGITLGAASQKTVTNYAGVGTSGVGLIYVPGTIALDNHTDTTRTDTLYQVASLGNIGRAGLYRFTYAYNVHTAQAGAIMTMTFTWLDSVGTSHTLTKTLDLSTTSNFLSGDQIIFVQANQTLSVTSAIAGGGTGAYDARMSLEQTM